MPTTVEERVKKRTILRRGQLGESRYVRFEREIEPQLNQLSDAVNVEVAELVRVAVDEMLERKGIQALMKVGALAQKTARPKVVGADASHGRYVPLPDIA